MNSMIEIVLVVSENNIVSIFLERNTINIEILEKRRKGPRRFIKTPDTKFEQTGPNGLHIHIKIF